MQIWSNWEAKSDIPVTTLTNQKIEHLASGCTVSGTGCQLKQELIIASLSYLKVIVVMVWDSSDDNSNVGGITR